MTTPSDRPTCPACDRGDGVEHARDTPGSPDIPVWRCVRCGTSWTGLIINPRPRPTYLADLGAAAEEIGRLRWALRQVTDLADTAPGLTDQQLRERLLALANHLQPEKNSR